MLTAIPILLYTLIIWYLYGRAVDTLLDRVLVIRLNSSITLTLLLGLAAVTTLGSFTSLFIRIGLEFQLVLLAGAVGLAVYIIRQKTLLPALHWPKLNRLQIAGALVMLIGMGILLYAGCLPPENADTGIYHAQGIHWIENYPAVPGLANLHKRLGYNSSWLVTTAIFSLSFLGGLSYHLSTLALFLVLAGYCYGGIHHLLAGKRSLSDFLKLGYFVGILIFQFPQISSPGTDSPAFLIGWFILTETTAILETDRERLKQTGFALLILCCYSITIKLSAGPMLLIAVWIVFAAGLLRTRRKFWLTALAVVLIAAPFIARNIILTGYPVFPGFGVNLFGVDWAYPADEAIEEVGAIHWYALHSEVKQEVYDTLSFFEQFKLWFLYQLPRYRAIIVYLLAAFPGFAILFIFKPWQKFCAPCKELWIVYLTAVVHCGYWVLTAPSFRFGIGVTLTMVLLLGIPVLLFILENWTWTQRFVPALVVLACVGAMLLTVKSYVHMDKLAAVAINPADYPDWRTEPCEYNNFSLFCPSMYGECWYKTFPCGFKGDSHVAMRGTDYRDGFKYVP